MENSIIENRGNPMGFSENAFMNFRKQNKLSNKESRISIVAGPYFGLLKKGSTKIVTEVKNIYATPMTLKSNNTT